MKSAKLVWSILLLLVVATNSVAQRSERLLTEWEFHRGRLTPNATWQQVSVPHDWAITGPFSEQNDLQIVAVTQNGETQPQRHQGRTGALPYSGEGHYRTHFRVEKGKEVTLLFDGAMSEARVSVNGQELIFWPYGYNSFSCNATPALREGDNLLEVSLRNSEQSSRWYPGAGLYRNVHLIEHERVHVPVWGTQVLTELSPAAGVPSASVTLRTELAGATPGQRVSLYTELLDEQGRVVASRSTQVEPHYLKHDEAVSQTFRVEHPQLWSPETPSLYRAVSRIYVDGVQTDCYSTRFGIRSIELLAEDGFYLNGQKRKMQGVCLHHDLGPLGAAIDRSALRHQLTMLKDMGCDAIRTSHNMPAPELVQLCEEMGLMMMLEPFDEWDIAKCDSGYHRWYEEWWEADMTNMLRHYRNSPAVVMWSIGNEVPSQGSEQGYQTASMLRDICHRLDPTRPVTAGMDQVDNAMDNGFGATLDVPGFNYRAHRYTEAHERFPQGLLLGSETASTVSSRGVYKFPVAPRDGALYDDHQSSSYDTEACWWSNVPDIDFANMDDLPWTIGQFVWTGFDYLGEPSPYDTDAWPSHSSLFGIIDLASLPKDRYYLYRSQWNRREHTLHLLPHWTWTGHEGEVIPVMAYTDAEEAELYLNGRSLGVARKQPEALSHDASKPTLESLMRYRLVWPDVKYEPGTLVVRAHYADGQVLCDTVRTAGQPHHLQLQWANEGEGDGLRYVTVSICDKDGNLCPTANHEVRFGVKGGAFRACANGDPTNLELFHEPKMHAFSGQLTAIVAPSDLPAQKGGSCPEMTLTATAKGLKGASITFPTTVERRDGSYVKGADIGWVTEMESKGEVVRNAEGTPVEMTQLMKDYGSQAVRCRVWIDPSKHDNWCNKEDVLQKCLRAKRLGMDVMIDFHYSDWWCDPGKQPVPATWSGKTVEEIRPLLRQHTVEVLSLLKQHGIAPKWVQVGNETTYGFLWSVREDPTTGWPAPEPDGRNLITEAIGRIDRPGRSTHHYAPGVTSAEGARAYATLFREGYEAVKSVFPKAQVIVHLDDGFDQELYDWNLGILRQGGAKWDIIGMSLYPYWALSEGKRQDGDAVITECMQNMQHLYEKFGTPSMLVEVGMDAMNPELGSRWLTRILRESRQLRTGDGRHVCLGAFYWEPACRPSQYRLGAFGEDGRPTRIMDVWKNN